MLPLRHRKLWHHRFVHQLADRRNAQFDRRPATDAVGVRQLGGAGRLHAHAAGTSVTSAFRHCLRVRNCRSDNLTPSCGGCLKMSCCFECVRCCRLLGLRCAEQGRVGRFYTRHRSCQRLSGLRSASDLADSGRSPTALPLEHSLDLGVGREACDKGMRPGWCRYACYPAPKLIFAVTNRLWLRRAIFISGGRSGSQLKVLIL